MKLKLLVPDNPLFDFFISGTTALADKHELEILRLPEKRIADLMLANRADAAVLSPLGYGMGLIKADYRIINSHLLALENYTDQASVYFRSGLKTFNTLASNKSEDFIVLVSRLLLSEIYDLNVELIQKDESNDFIMENYESSVLLGSSGRRPNTLDVSEEWFNQYEIELPLGFWVCRNEENSAEVGALLRELSAGVHTLDEPAAEPHEADSDGYYREGRILRNWNENSENAIDSALHLLFYHQYFPELPAVKILGRD